MPGCTSNPWNLYTGTQSLQSVNYYIALYTNNLTPSPANVVSDFIQPTVGGYAPISLSGGGWTPTIQANSYLFKQPNVTFTFTGGVTIYGYVIYNVGSSNFVFAELFNDGPYTFPSSGGALTMTPQLNIGTTIP